MKPDSKCQLCQEPVGHIYYDARVPRLGMRWANMCNVCHSENKCGLGTGQGQKFQWQEATQSWKKIAG